MSRDILNVQRNREVLEKFKRIEEENQMNLYNVCKDVVLPAGAIIGGFLLGAYLVDKMSE